MHGVFDLFPDLHVLLTGAGALWLPSVMWRLDHRLSVTRSDATWISRLPTEYIPHFAFATQRLEFAPDRERTAQVLSVLPDIESRLLYASGTPRRGALEAQETADRLPEAWTDNVLGQNALEFFRWPAEVPVPAFTTSKEL